MIGQTIHQYRITAKLGAGSMGVVYQAEDTRLDRTVALKFLSPDLTGDSQAKERFLREARAAAALDHEFICNIHDVTETEDGRLFIVMAFYEGQELKDKIKGGPLAPTAAVHLAIQCAKGLAAAHAEGIVHRDIKPANLFVTTAGKIKILDFGLAKLIGSAKLTRTGTTLGTASYLSPEQANGVAVDERTDIWSLGAVLYEMLAGHSPFKGDFEQAVIYQILNREPEPLPDTAEIDPELARITSRCLAKDPEDRYQSAADLAADLEQLIEVPAYAKSLSEHDPGRDKPPRHRLRNLSISSALLGVIITAVILLTPSQGIPFSMRDWILITDFENQTGEEIFQGTVSEALSIDLQQSQYVNVFSGKRLNDALFRSGQAGAAVIDAELGRQIAIREGVTAVLEGKISRVGEEYVLSARLVVPTTGEAVDTKRIRVHSREEFLGAVDELSRDIRRNLGESMLSIQRRDQPLAEVTTSSLQALRYFTLSQQKSRMARWEESIPLLEKAVEVDSTFATALNDLAVMAQNLLRITDALRYSQQAYRHREKVTERERYHIEGEYFRIREEFGLAIDRYNLLLQLYPDDYPAINNLAYTCIYTRQYAEAKAHAQRLMENQPDNWYALHIMGLACGGLGEYEQAIAQFQDALVVNPDAFWSHVSLGMVHAINGRWEQAWSELDESLVQGMQQNAIRIRFSALFHIARGNYQAAATNYQEAVRLFRSQEDWSAEAAELRSLARLQAAMGEPAEALRTLERAVQIQPSAESLAYLGRQQIQNDLEDPARQTAARLESLCEDAPTMGNLGAYHHLLGDIAQSTGEIDLACDEFTLALNLTDRLETRFALGVALGQAGDHAQAREQFTLLASNPWSTFFDGYPELRALSLYHLGMLSEADSSLEEAEGYFDQFMALWGDKGNDRPEVALARQKLKGFSQAD